MSKSQYLELARSYQKRAFIYDEMLIFAKSKGKALHSIHLERKAAECALRADLAYGKAKDADS